MPGNCYTEALPSRLKKYFVILFLLLTRGHFITASTAGVRTHGDFGNIPSPLFLIKYMSNFAEGGLVFIRIFDYNLSWLFISTWRQDRHRSVAYELFVRFTDCRKVGCLDPSHTDFMRRGTHTGSNAGRCILGHSRECYKTNRRENQKRKVYKETHRK